jgi:hypothetical protein
MAHANERPSELEAPVERAAPDHVVVEHEDAHWQLLAYRSVRRLVNVVRIGHAAMLIGMSTNPRARWPPAEPAPLRARCR